MPFPGFANFYKLPLNFVLVAFGWFWLRLVAFGWFWLILVAYILKTAKVRTSCFRLIWHIKASFSGFSHCKHDVLLLQMRSFFCNQTFFVKVAVIFLLSYEYFTDKRPFLWVSDLSDFIEGKTPANKPSTTCKRCKRVPIFVQLYITWTILLQQIHARWLFKWDVLHRKISCLMMAWLANKLKYPKNTSKLTENLLNICSISVRGMLNTDKSPLKHLLKTYRKLT